MNQHPASEQSMHDGSIPSLIDWTDGDLPLSRRFEDPYFSLQDGLAETRYVFLDGNGLPGRFRPGFHIAELGFGTGLNMLAAWAAWRETGIDGALRFTSFEAYPLAAADIERALAAFPELAPLAAPFVAQWAQGARIIRLEGLEATIVIGDARHTLPRWQGQADAWFLDGFAPARNPELWEPELLANLARHSAPGATMATYTAAGAVRRSLTDAGFTVTDRKSVV